MPILVLFKYVGKLNSIIFQIRFFPILAAIVLGIIIIYMSIPLNFNFLVYRYFYTLLHVL